MSGAFKIPFLSGLKNMSRAYVGGFGANLDKTGSVAANAARLYSLYKGDDPRTNLASPICAAPVDALRAVVGAPIFKAEDDATQKAANELHKYCIDESPLTTAAMLVCGTDWRFPRVTERGWEWRQMRDDEIIGIAERDGNISEVWARRSVQTKAGGVAPTSKMSSIETHWTEDFIETRVDGGYERRDNFFHVLPLPFSHRAVAGEWRGVGVYSTVFRSALMLHDLVKSTVETLAQFKPKLIFNSAHYDGTKDYFQRWFASTFGSGDSEKSPIEAQFIGLLTDDAGKDAAEFVFMPSDAISGAERMIDRVYKHIIAGSGIEEIFWPPVMTNNGNYATASVQTQMGIARVNEIRREQTKWYERMANDTLRMLGYMRGVQYGRVSVDWKGFDVISETERAQVFSQFASGLSTMYNAGQLTEQGVYYFVKEFYPDFPAKNADELSAEILAWGETHKPAVAGGYF
ncbi:MAG: hypothetical protein LBL45_10195 [Treponema sp.]|jgi:hypothetical protein|nr:hypothetical protein [Treponema sp.]